MKAIIHYNNRMGYEDSLILTGNSIEEIREKAHAELAKRGWDEDHCWSEVHQDG